MTKTRKKVKPSRGICTKVGSGKCSPKNHDLCLCGHQRMDHLELPKGDGGGCWGQGTDCWPRCLTYEPATDEMVDAFFRGYMAQSPDLRMDQEDADAFREEFLERRYG